MQILSHHILTQESFRILLYSSAQVVDVYKRQAPLRPIDDDGQLLVGRYEFRVKARRSALIQDHRAAAL